MAELTVRRDELVVTVEPREKQRLTWFGLRTSRSKLLGGLELRVPLAEVTAVHVSDAYGVTKKKLCFIHGQHSPVVAVDLNVEPKRRSPPWSSPASRTRPTRSRPASRRRPG